MKPEPDKKMDSLLRWYGKNSAQQQSAAPRSSDAEQETSVHFDADEINAYAENVLPPATRTRYMAHLADCERCRKLVTSIALSVNRAKESEEQLVVQQPERHARTVSFWQRLSTLFAPRTLRYIAPVLALALVGVITFIATRSNRNESYVADNVQKEQSGDLIDSSAINEPSVETSRGNQAMGPARSGPASAAASSSVHESRRAAGKPETESKSDEELASNSSATNSADAGAGATTSALSSPVQSATNTATAPASAAATAPPAAAPEQAQSANVTQDQSQQTKESARAAVSDDDALRAESRKNQSSATGKRVELEVNGRAYVSEEPSTKANRMRAEEKRETNKAGEAGFAAGPAPKKRAASSRAEADARSDVPAETRSVAGRKFHRHGQTWIDASYNSSMITINVTRGSEQYRALMADEPDLRHIAEQLGGEVVVVWKGRAYRIR